MYKTYHKAKLHIPNLNIPPKLTSSSWDESHSNMLRFSYPPIVEGQSLNPTLECGLLEVFLLSSCMVERIANGVRTMGTIIHLDDYRRHNKKKSGDQSVGALSKRQAREQTSLVKPLGRRKASYPELQKRQGREGLSDPS